MAVPAGLTALIAAAAWPPAWWVAGALGALLLVLNAPLYWFFARKRGAAFALGCVLWHWLYYLYSGAAFALGAGRHVIATRSTRSLGNRAVPLDATSTGTARVRAR